MRLFGYKIMPRRNPISAKNYERRKEATFEQEFVTPRNKGLFIILLYEFNTERKSRCPGHNLCN